MIVFSEKSKIYTSIFPYVSFLKVYAPFLKVSFLTENIDDHKKVPPMLLIPFVENAFKHGNLIDGYLRVDVKIRMDNNTLQFQIKNTVKSEDAPNKKPGIGLENIKKRLDLIYPKDYKLSVKTENNWYIVDLLIENINDV